jgi:hypothetical protein
MSAASGNCRAMMDFSNSPTLPIIVNTTEGTHSVMRPTQSPAAGYCYESWDSSHGNPYWEQQESSIWTEPEIDRRLCLNLCDWFRQIIHGLGRMVGSSGCDAPPYHSQSQVERLLALLQAECAFVKSMLPVGRRKKESTRPQNA